MANFLAWRTWWKSRTALGIYQEHLSPTFIAVTVAHSSPLPFRIISATYHEKIDQLPFQRQSAGINFGGNPQSQIIYMDTSLKGAALDAYINLEMSRYNNTPEDELIIDYYLQDSKDDKCYYQVYAATKHQINKRINLLGKWSKQLLYVTPDEVAFKIFKQHQQAINQYTWPPAIPAQHWQTAAGIALSILTDKRV